MKKAAIYLRSTKDRSDVSIDAQRRQLTDLAAERGLLIVEEFVDAVESGKDEYRPGFQSLVAAVKNKNRGWSAILVLDTSRLARRKNISIVFEEYDCRRNNVELIYKSVPDSDPINEMMIKSVMQMMDEYLSMISKAKGMAGMAENVKQGYRAGGSAPRGYKLEYMATGAVRDGEAVTKSKLVPDDEALLVKSYLQARAKGLNRKDALAKINQDWPHTSCYSIEMNARTYAGHTVWNRTNEKAPGGGYVGGSKFKPQSEWVINEKTHQALITDGEADLILDQLASKKKVRATKSNHAFYLLTGLLVSPEGEKWQGDAQKFYRLGKGRRISSDMVDDLVLDGISDDITSDQFVDAVLNHYKEMVRNINADPSTEIFKKNIKELKRKNEKLLELMLNTSAKDTYVEAIEKNEDSIKQLEYELNELEEKQKIKQKFANFNAEDVKKFLQNIAELFKSGNEKDHIKQSLESIVDQVIVDLENKTATITYKVESVSGGKLASPRVREANPSFGFETVIQLPLRAPRPRKSLNHKAA